MRELVVKDNALINASYNLELVEQRLILLAIIEARESGRGINANDPLTVHADNYITQFDVHRTTAYQALKDACDDLFVRQFSYQEVNQRGNIENIRSRWVSEVRYIDNEAVVKLIFAPAIIPLITKLEQQFTKYELEQVSSLSSAYAVRLYELLIQWRSIGRTPEIPLNEFRQKIGVLDADYTRMYDFKKRVLDLSVTQINTHTDITVSYDQHKSGRVITGFSFTFKPKVTAQPEAKPKPQKSPKSEPKKDELLDDIQKIASDFSSLDKTAQEQVLKNVQNELSGLKESQFIIELSAYNATGSTTIFQHYKDYFTRGLAVLGYL